MTDEKKKRKKADIPEKESKQARFIRVITPRMKKALKALKMVSNCGGVNYSYTPEQVKKVEDTLIEATANCIECFKKGKQDTGESFSL